MSETVQLELHVNAGDVDAEGLDVSTRHLRTELQELPIEFVAPLPGGRAPDGTKAGDVATLGALTLSLAPIVVPALIELLKSWIGRKEGRSVVIRKKSGTSSTEIEIKSPLSDSALAALLEQLRSDAGTAG